MPFRWRPDGDYVGNVPATRKIMPYIMRTRAESVVYFEQKIDTENAARFLQQFRERTGLRATMLHLVIWAAARAIDARPRLNRFTAGGRIFQRRGIWVSFSAKKAKTDDHPIVVVKRHIDPSWSFEELVHQIDDGILDGRSDRKSATDKELALVFKLPSLLIWLAAWLLMKLDRYGWLPADVMRNDPLYCSLFIAPLGSIGLEAGYHHLFEYGNCPIFMVMGREQLELVPDSDGAPVARKRITLRYTFDERVEDGLYCVQALELFQHLVENPAEPGTMAVGARAGEA